MKNEQSTLEADLKELMRLVRKINALEQDINEKYGVRMIAGYIPGMIGDRTVWMLTCVLNDWKEEDVER